jgi:hypothetical protein
MAIAGGKRGRDTAQRIAPMRVRENIRVGVLLKLLDDYATGKRKCEPHQITAATVLLRKAVPDLQAITLSGDENAPLTIITRME